MTELKKYNYQLQLEHELINRKLTWLLSSQSILFASLAFELGNVVQQEQYRMISNIICLFGMSILLLIFIGVLTAVAAKLTTWKDYNRQSPIAERQQLGGLNWITFLALMPDVFYADCFYRCVMVDMERIGVSTIDKEIIKPNL